MKNLSEEEILQRLNARREKFEITYEEVTNPDYEVWGRAREWSYSQSLCLLSQLIPLSAPFLKQLLDYKNVFTLVELSPYYPICNTDITRLKNFDRLLKTLPKIRQIQQEDLCLSPKEFLNICKNYSDIVPHLPQELMRIVEEIGPHLSLNLPNCFSQLEIDPNTFKARQKRKEQAKTPPLHMQPTSELTPPISLPPIPKEHPLEIAKRLFPLQDVNYWRNADILSVTEVILLHYNIDPCICRVHPNERTEDPRSNELGQYLKLYFYGDLQWFLNQLDKNDLQTLLQRSLDAGTILFFRGNRFSTVDIVKWMESKKLSFPFMEENQEQTKAAITINEILNINFYSWTPDQKLKLMARLMATAIWNENENFILKEVVNHKASLAIRKAWAELHKRDDCADRTYEDYIRDINPNYKPRK